MSIAKFDPAIELIRRHCLKAVRHQIATNTKGKEEKKETGFTEAELKVLHSAVRVYSQHLRSLQKATATGARSKGAAAKERIFEGFSGRLIATLRALAGC
ncbi:hypothetical protein NKJ81_29005 [Mesorhizobium sp. M0018]|uniref:hypothetical protein n=1 Tax=Mesorhizobium sp. M0018 TaxID=2956844 RepID=UPI0033395245